MVDIVQGIMEAVFVIAAVMWICTHHWIGEVKRGLNVYCPEIPRHLKGKMARQAAAIYFPQPAAEYSHRVAAMKGVKK